MQLFKWSFQSPNVIFHVQAQKCPPPKRKNSHLQLPNLKTPRIANAYRVIQKNEKRANFSRNCPNRWRNPTLRHSQSVGEGNRSFPPAAPFSSIVRVCSHSRRKTNTDFIRLKCNQHLFKFIREAEKNENVTARYLSIVCCKDVSSAQGRAKDEQEFRQPPKNNTSVFAIGGAKVVLGMDTFRPTPVT